MSFIGDLFGDEPEQKAVTTTVKPTPPVFGEPAQPLLDPLSQLLQEFLGGMGGDGGASGFLPDFYERVREVSGAGGPTTLSPFLGEIGEAGQASILDILGGKFDPTLHPEGFEAAFGAASAPMIRQFKEQILPMIQGQATRLGVPSGSGAILAGDLATGRLGQSLEDLSGSLFAQREELGARTMMQALGLAPTMEQLPYANMLQQARTELAKFAPLGAEADIISTMMGLEQERGVGRQTNLAPILEFIRLMGSGPGSVTTSPVFMEAGPTDLEKILGTAGGVAQVIGPLLPFIMSAKKYKKDIEPTTPMDTKEALKMVKDLDTQTYRYLWEGSDTPKRMGLMADEAPESVVTPDREGIDVGRMLGLLTVATKGLAERR